MEVRARHIPRTQRPIKPTEGATSQQPRATQGTAKPQRQQTQGKSPTTKDTSESRQGIPAPHPDPPAPTRVEATPQTGTSRDNSSKATKPTTQKTTPAKKPDFQAALYMKPAAKTTEAATSINSDQDTTQATRGIPNSSQAPTAHTTPQPGPNGAPTIPTSPLPQRTPKPDRQRHSSLQMTPTNHNIQSPPADHTLGTSTPATIRPENPRTPTKKPTSYPLPSKARRALNLSPVSSTSTADE